VLKNESKLTKWSLGILAIILTLYFMEPARAETTVDEVVDSYIVDTSGFGFAIIGAGLENYVYAYAYAIANVKYEAGLLDDVDDLATTTFNLSKYLLTCDALEGTRKEVVRRWVLHVNDLEDTSTMTYTTGIMHFMTHQCGVELDAVANWIFSDTTTGGETS